MASPQSEFTAGVKGVLPFLPGIASFGMLYGVLALQAGLPAGLALAASSIILSGSAQVVSAQLIAGGAPPLIVVLTALIVNLRHLLYSASLAPHLQRLSPLWKLLLAHLLIDEVYVITIAHYQRAPSPPPGQQRHWYFLGAGLGLWGTWQASTALGVFFGARLPAGWALDFVPALTFIALVFPALVDRASLAAAVSAGLVAVLAADLPLKLGLMVAALTGIAVGLLLEGRLAARRSEIL